MEGTLSPGRVERLDALGMRWHRWADVKDTQWLNRMAQFCEENGHVEVPVRYCSPDGARLGAWVAATRQRHVAGLLSQGVVVALNEMGFRWKALSPDERFERGIQHFQAWLDQGHPPESSEKTLVNGFALGKWLSNQRTSHRLGRLSEVRRARLEAMGFEFVRQSDLASSDK